ncbi:MAG: carboxypeptidase regulatory-like domain-containing protein [Gemmatimonadaceae bacterium]
MAPAPEMDKLHHIPSNRSAVRLSVIAVCVVATICNSICAGSPLNAQVVRGRVVESASGAPIKTAIVSLLLSDSTPTGRRTLTDATGAFAITAPAGGHYLIDVRSIGFRRFLQLTELAEGRTETVDLRLTRATFALSSVRVEARRSCRPPDHIANNTTEIWDDVWVALSATTIADANTASRQSAFRYRREIDASNGWVTSERRVQRDGPSFTPFAALDPRDLARLGFLREDEAGSIEIYAPDARTFLSTEFIAHHCFALTRDDSATVARVGIAFWPQRNWSVRGIDGVFWLDPSTRELRKIDFTYPGLARIAADSLRLGGVVDFARDDNGAWFVSRWHIRAPVIQRSRPYLVISGKRVEQDPRDSVAAISEEGGIVVTPATRLASIRGRVLDAATQAPLAGAVVELPGIVGTTTVDSTGSFALTQLLPGRYHVRVARPGSDDPRALWHNAMLNVRDGENVRHDVMFADTRALARTACSQLSQRAAPTVALYGVIRDARTGAPLPAHSIELQWSRFTIEGKSEAIVLKGENQSLTTDEFGAFSTCRIPELADVTMRDPNQRAANWSAPVRLGPFLSVLDIRIDSAGEIRRVDGGLAVVIPKSSGVFVADLPPNARSLVGVVIDADSTAAPIGGVEVQIAGVSRVAMTDTSGHFTFDALAPGPHVIFFRRLGFAPSSQTVTIGDDEHAVRSFRLSRAAAVLSELRVSGESDAASLGLRDFRDRQRAGFGKFVGPEEFDKAANSPIATFIMARVQGFEFVPLNRGSMAAGMGLVARRFQSIGRRGAPPPPCFAQVFVDGARANGMQNDAFDFSQLQITDIAAMEFYRSASETPTQFSGPSAACGTVVIWTKVAKAKP